MIQDYFPAVIDSSMLGCFKSCPQLMYKIFIEDWHPKEGANVHLVAGGAFAKGVEVARRMFFEVGMAPEDCMAMGLRALVKAYGDFECPPDSAKSLERMMGALTFYFERYPLNHQSGYPIVLASGKRAIECNGAEPLPIAHPITGDPLLYSWRTDAIVYFSSANYVCDEKTTSSLGPTWGRQWDLRSQFIGYKFWSQKTLEIPIAGALVRGVSILKTKYDTLEVPCNYSAAECQRWYDEMLEWTEAMIECWKKGRWRYNLDHACAEYGGCGFRTVCKAEADGAGKEILETFFERRRWDPVSRTETLLSTGEVVRQA